MTTLFTPIQLGDLRLPNRIFMAPLTRLRGTEDHLPQPDLMAKYYRQRATAGLILSEGLPVDPMAVGYARVPDMETGSSRGMETGDGCRAFRERHDLCSVMACRPDLSFKVPAGA